MTTEEWIHAISNPAVNEYVHAQARRHCRRSPQRYRDYCQEAWLWIGAVCRDSNDDEFIKSIAYNAIRNAYRKDIGEDHRTFEDVLLELTWRF